MQRLNNSPMFEDWLGRFLTQPLRYRRRKPSAFFLTSSPIKLSDGAINNLAVDSHPTLPCEDSMTEIDGEEESDGADINDSNSKDTTELVDYSSGDYDDDYEDEDDDDQILPMSIRSRHSVASKHMFHSVEELLTTILNNEPIITTPRDQADSYKRFALRRLEGVRFAHINGHTVYIDGVVSRHEVSV